MQIAGLQGRILFLSLDVDRITANLQAYPVIREADVTKSFPDQLSIVLRKRIPARDSPSWKWERNPSRSCLTRTEWSSRLALGLLLQSTGGLRCPHFPEIALGMRLPDRTARVFLSETREIAGFEPGPLRMISEVEFAKKRQADYEVLLYTDPAIP
jgi:hypothetical protein